MTIQFFATKRNLRATKDKGDDTTVIRGRYGHLYEYDDDHLAVIYMGDSVGKANTRRKACAAAGMEVAQDGDTEFAATFNSSDKKQASLAIKTAGVKTRRTLSQVQKEQLRAARAVNPRLQNRVKPLEETHSDA